MRLFRRRSLALGWCGGATPCMHTYIHTVDAAEKKWLKSLLSAVFAARVAKMKVKTAALLALPFGAVLGQDTYSVNSTHPELQAQYKKLSDAILSKALERIDENERCARAKGEEPTCTRDKLVFRKE